MHLTYLPDPILFLSIFSFCPYLFQLKGKEGPSIAMRQMVYIPSHQASSFKRKTIRGIRKGSSEC